MRLSCRICGSMAKMGRGRLRELPNGNHEHPWCADNFEAIRRDQRRMGAEYATRPRKKVVAGPRRSR